jgi:diguanylate cyclase (GGDEF)-like protein
MGARSWLCPTELDHCRVTDAGDRVRHARTVAAVALGAALLVTTPWLGAWTLALFGLAVLNLLSFERRFVRSERPERVAAGSLLFTLALLTTGAALSGGPDSPILAWFVIPTAMAATRFRAEVVFSFAALAGLAALAVSLAVDPAGLIDDPVPLITAIALQVGVTAACSALISGEIKHRDAAVLDPLTGLLNRTALESRIVELEQQARLNGASVCFVACDIDGFKLVNDNYGHDRGDTVLRAVAYEMRKRLRSFDLAYRLGGEEFLIVLPDVDLSSGLKLAERMRSGLEEARPDGLGLTMSFGVSAGAGEQAEFRSLFKAADAALYEAKRAGRNRVVASPNGFGPAPSLNPAALPAVG